MVGVLKYIHENIRLHLNLEEIATQFGYSKWHFCKKFRQFTGMTFLEYVRHYRIQLAALDILSGTKVTDVALDYGYDSLGGFQKAFLAEYGCLPKEYKKQAKESQLYYERRRTTMYPLSNRCMILRDDAVHTKSHLRNFCAQRNVYFALGLQEAKKKTSDPHAYIGMAVAHVLKKFTPFIAPHELVVGFNFGDAHYGEWCFPKNNPEDIALLKENGVSDEDMEAYFETDTIQKDDYGVLWGCDVSGNPLGLTKEEENASYEWSALGRCICSNHSVIGYERVLKVGFEGLLKEVDAWEEKNGKGAFYDGIRVICEAALEMGEKYAQKAQELLDSGDSAYDAEDLKKIIAVCKNVPRHPASNFAEAVQSLFFAHIVNTWEDGINANSLGHLDQILYPYYQKDIEAGILTKEQAFEIVCCLWVKLYRDYDVQQSCLGGTSPDGKSLVNDLSYMMLDATEQLDFVRCLSVRYSQNTEKEFLKRALEVVGHVQKGIPFFFNDDVMVPALINAGIAPEDAYDYTQIGCVETLIPGKTNPHAVTGETNLLKAIEYVLCNGHSMKYPEFCPGVQTGELEKFATYQEFYDAVICQVDRILELTCSQVEKHCNACVAPKPYKSLLTEGCMESAKDFNERGALYDYYQIMLGGVPNLADSLMVIKKFVYDEHRYTLAEMKTILEQNFPDEAVRLDFINKASKFGNDIDEVDRIAVEIVDHSCDILEQLSKKHQMSFHAQPFTFLWMIDHGNHSAASPDGRRAGEPIAYSVSPMQGRDFNGLTAVLNSIAKFPTTRTPGTTSAIVEVDPKLFTDKNIGILTDLFLASSKKGLCNVQFNTIDADTLIDAKNNPERYQNLAVRVSGFSQKFNLLSPELQDHIIGRTKHACL
ncbi:MAG: helix-turn-helix domain-containing protein [Ruminococcaceae bacterium]|nr:helix-turn-helix domain-containing protein [Oscillospiraceae bacterium]